MKKREFWKLFTLFLLMGLMGCGGNANDNQQVDKNEKEREELTLWSYYETAAQREGLDKLVREFNESQQEYKVSWEYVPMADFIRNLSFSQAGDTLPDMVLMDNPDMGSLIKIGLLADITDRLKENGSVEDYYPEVWKFVDEDGRYYGIPFCCNNTAIIYNRKLFEEKNLEIPTTWEEFKETAAALTEGDRYGFAMSAMGGEQGAFQFMPWMLAAGVSAGNMADGKGKDAFYLIKDLLQAKSMPNDCMNWSQNDLTRGFIDGKIAMMENGPWALAQLDASGVDYGIFEFPSRVSTGVVLGGEVLAAVEGMNVDGAVSFINYYNRKEVMEDICQITGNIPPRIELAGKFGEENKACRVFVEQMSAGISRKSIKDWKKICNALSDSLNQMFGSERNAEEIWQEYVERLERER